KVKALQQVHFLVGKGQKKYRALQSVSEGIGQSVETLRDWEKMIVTDEDLRMDLVAAHLAGEHEAELDAKPPLQLRKTLAQRYHRNKRDSERARNAREKKGKTSIKKKRNGIRMERKGGGKKRPPPTKKKVR